MTFVVEQKKGCVAQLSHVDRYRAVLESGVGRTGVMTLETAQGRLLDSTTVAQAAN